MIWLLQASIAADTGQADGSGLDSVASNSMEEFHRLQRRLLLSTLLLSVVASALTFAVFGAPAGCSLVIGSSCGLLYLRLLARSVARLGNEARSLSRFQILVPALLVVACTRLPSLELIPALAGFVLYKPALLLQAVFAP